MFGVILWATFWAIFEVLLKWLENVINLRFCFFFCFFDKKKLKLKFGDNNGVKIV